MNILKKLSEIKSEISNQGRTYPMVGLILLVMVGLMSNCNSYASISRFGKRLGKKGLGLLGLPKAPVLSTISENIRKIEISSLEQILGEISEQIMPQKEKVVSMDGKRLRGSKRQAKDAKHLLGMFAHNSLHSYGQEELAAEDNEITAAIKLLEKVNLQGITITGDAIFAQRSLVQKIVEEKGNFLFTVKDNQENLKRDIQTAFLRNTAKEYEEEVTKAHGRIERRSIAVIDMPWEYNNEWQHIKQIACVTSTTVVE